MSQQSSKLFTAEDFDTQLVTKIVKNKRPKPRVIHKKNNETSDEEKQEEFTASPADDIPRNRLVEKLVSGMQAYLERM